ncbi:MAG: zinc-ribbon domain-containing protein [Candidatus Nitrosocosmicus sp.]
MNKAHSMIAAFSLVIGAILVLPALNIAYAQYSAPAGSGGITLEEQLKLAKAKITNAQQQGAYGSGTSMFGGNLDSTVIMIIIIGVVMGGVAAAFFVASSKGAKKTVQKLHDGSSTGGSGRFCTTCGAQASGETKFCGNCGTKL